MDKKGSLAYPTAAVDETTMLSSGRDLTPAPLTRSPRVRLFSKELGARLLCPSSHFRRSHLWCWAFPPAISAHPGCNPAPKPPWGQFWKPQACGVWG